MSSNIQSNDLKKYYSEIIQQYEVSEFNEKHAAESARELSRYGREATLLLTERMKKADPGELRKIILMIRHLDHQGFDEGMIEVVTTRIIPLDLKMDYFHAMSQMGISLDGKFLNQLQQADELYLQLSGQLKSDSEGSIKRSLELVEDFQPLPGNLKRSFLLELAEGLPRALPFCLAVIGHNEEVDNAVIDIILTLEDAAVAAALVEVSAKELPKASTKRIRKELYRLKEKGVQIPEKRQEENELIENASSGEVAYATTMDSFGARLLLVRIPTLSGVLACQAACDDAKGLLRFSAVEMPRKQFREFLREFKEQVKDRGISSLVKIDFPHCCYLLKRAYEKNLETGTLIPENYKKVMYRIKPPQDYSLSQELEKLLHPEPELVAAMKEDFENVFTLKEISFWMVEKEKLLSYTSKYVEMLESQIVSDEAQREKILNDSIEEFAKEYFTALQMEKLKQRFEETAYLLANAGRKGDGELIMALMKSIESFADNWLEHKFFGIFVLRSIVGTIEAFKKERARSENLNR